MWILHHAVNTPIPYDQCIRNVINGAINIVEKDRDGDVPIAAPAQHSVTYNPAKLTGR